MKKKELKRIRNMLPTIFKQIVQLAAISTHIQISCDNGIVEGPPTKDNYATCAPNGEKSIAFYFYVPKHDKRASLFSKGGTK